jgi:hypothetical protein
MLMDHPKFLWAEAIACATYLYDHLPHRGIENKFPIQMLDSIDPPPFHHLHPFGCKAYIHIPDEARPSGSKLQPRAVEGIFVGYTPSSKYISHTNVRFATQDKLFSLLIRQGKFRYLLTCQSQK